MFNSIRNKILLSNAVLLVILMLVSIFALTQLHLNQQLLEQEEQAVEAEMKIATLQENFIKYRLSAVEYLVLLQDNRKEARDSGFDKLSKIVTSSTSDAIKKLGPDLLKINDILQRAAVAFINDDKMQGAILLNQASTVSDGVQTALVEQTTYQKKEVERLIAEVNNSNAWVSYSLYTLMVAMVVVGAAISLFLANMISCALRRLQKTVQDIEQTGDLTMKADTSTQDEIGSLAESFNQLVKNLSNIVRQVIQESDRLAKASENLSSITEKTNTGVARQSDEINQVATAVNEMSASIREVASSAQFAYNSAEEGNREASKGSDVVNQTLAVTSEMATEVQHSSEVIEKLKLDSENINSVLDVIKTIAEQTNLLALNAAIEAARAGEQGRGFAVVADEVRTLAQRTQDSTKEIEELIETLQTAAQQGVDAMVSSKGKADNTVSQAQQAGETLHAITESVSKILDVNTQIASAAEEQSATAEEINRSINSIQAISEETASGAKQTASASNELKKLSGELRTLVDRFKV